LQAAADSLRRRRRTEEENLAGRAEQLPDVIHTEITVEFHASCCQNLLRLAGRPPSIITSGS
jgi:hypothetical protein